MKCPICEKELQSTAYQDGGVTSEEHAKCQDEHHFYSYAYAYGTTEEAVGNVVFYRHYTHTEEERKHDTRLFNAVVAIEKEEYQKKSGGK